MRKSRSGRFLVVRNAPNIFVVLISFVMLAATIADPNEQEKFR